MPEIRKVLFVQQPDVLDQHRDLVERLLTQELGADVDFTASPDDVVAGAHFDVVIAPTVAWLTALLDRIEGPRWIHFLSAGVEKIWTMDWDWHSVALTKSSGVHAAPMSEYALGAVLYFAKQFNRFVEQSRQSIWQRAWLDELTGRDLVVIGLGSIGRAVAERARAFGMNVHGVARTPRVDADFGQVLGLDGLPDLLPIADFVVVSLPLTAETAGLVNEGFFRALRKGSVLVDMSRGGVVSAEAVIAALDDGTLRGAALDVFEIEPLPEHSPLWSRPDVLLTPHVAGTTPLYVERAMDIFLENAQRYQADEPFSTPVDVTHGY